MAKGRLAWWDVRSGVRSIFARAFWPAKRGSLAFLASIRAWPPIRAWPRGVEEGGGPIFDSVGRPAFFNRSELKGRIDPGFSGV